jgi:uncharacterized membrane protein YgcG
MQPRHLIRVALIAAVLVLAACQQMDPYTRTDEWQPNGANAGNISAMVADPYDLIRGRGADVSDSKASNHSIGHVWSDQPKPLLDAVSSSGGSGAGGYGGGSGGGTGGGSSGGGPGGGATSGGN